MKVLKSSKTIAVIIIGLFVLTRIFIWINRPIEFTEIIYSYMPYAHLWASGVKPYLEQWYEYPPITIPLFYLPHLIDQGTYSSVFHLTYLQAYRGLLLLVDMGLFALVWRTLVLFKVKPKHRWLALIYYCLVTAKANHFIYDTMDWTFAAALALAAAPLIWSSPKWQQRTTSFLGGIQTWLGYWLAVGLKLLNAPLGLPYALLQRKQWKTQWLALLVTGLAVWGFAIVTFRSSLSVMLVYHQMRGLQVDSATAIIVRVINSFTHSESIIEIYKNYELTGPLTTVSLQLLNILFPIVLIIFTLWASRQAWHMASRTKQQAAFRLSITLGYVLLLMLFSKVLSRPFVLWHVPLVAMLPVSHWRQQLSFIVPSMIVIAVTLSPIPDFPLGPFQTATLVGVIRTLAFISLLVTWWRRHKRQFTL